MLSEQFCRLRPTSSRGWSWHSVPASKRRGAFSPIPSRNFCKISGQPSLLKHQRKSNKMVSFRDYEMNLLFLLLVKFHGSGNCEIFSPHKGFYSVFYRVPFLSLDTKDADPLFLNVMFVKMISELQGGFQQFLYFKFKIRCWDFNPVMNEVWITMMR